MPRTRILLLGSGELGREVALEAIRLGCHVTAADRYADAPAMQVSQEHRVLDMTDPAALTALVEELRPDLIVPEVEAIATQALQGYGNVIPTARATQLTMNREGIRRLAAEELGLLTSPYRFASSEDEVVAAVEELGRPAVVKPVMSSSGKGQSVVSPEGDPRAAWAYAQKGGRVGGGPVIVEGFVPFAYELTLLTVRHAGGTTVCPPVGHIQVDGDYRESWQPAAVPDATFAKARDIAERVTTALGGHGLFGVEVFVLDDGNGEQSVLFSEVSPRPHDTGMVTMATQRLSEFALHVRAILGLPIADADVAVTIPGASCVVLGPDTAAGAYEVGGLEEALSVPDSQIRVFGKPEAWPRRRLAVALATGADVDEARARARTAAGRVVIT